jgi:glycine oxidase
MPAKGASIVTSLSPARSLPRVAIIGGGAIGLSIGWRLAQAGAEVDIFERHLAGRGASHAAAGMLAAGVETEPGEARLTELNLLSQRLWPAFRAELEAASGLDIGYRDDGTLQIALTRDDVQKLRAGFEFQTRYGIALEWLSGSQTRELEPHLSAQTVAGVLCRADHQVDNRLLATALVSAFLSVGGALHEQSPATLDRVGGRVIGVVVGERSWPADIVILAGGAWSAELPGLPPEATPPVRPIKGQMMALRMAEPLLRHVLWAPGAYVVPRSDGRLILGATVEEQGFDERLTAGGIYGLLDGAWRAIPAIEELPIDEMWVGFRPGSRDDAPILGPAPLDGLVLATGHHRNGILLTPVTADAIAHYVLSGALPESIKPFGLERFGPVASRGAA